MIDSRPNPDELLAQVEKEERKRVQGKLKIFLGYSAGVGKTYSMLEDAHLRKKQGTEVVVGFLESHGRKETEKLLEGLEVLSQSEVAYRGIKIREMDLDAILAKRPELVLVDELAHTNAPESRHSKRYQDVLEILENGIDVYTTLNIQHLESVNDTVSKITGIKVKETIPDSVLNKANEIKVVDIPPQELLQRFKDGKIYIPDQAAIAVENFFKEGNLIALRELVLRRAAEHVDGQMLEFMHAQSIPGPWPVGERLLVCIGNNMSLNERLVRTGRRLADELKAEWYALYVETPTHNRLSRRARQDALKGVELASSLGAITSTSFGVTVAEEVVRFAKKNNITRIIVGRVPGPRWQEFIFYSVVNQIVRLSADFDMIVISEQRTKDIKRKEREEPEEAPKRPHPLNRYIYNIWLVFLITIFGVLIRSFISPTNLVMIYLIGVVVAAITWGLWQAIFTAGVSVLAFDFFFLPPFLEFRVTDSEYLITFLAFLFVGVVISLLVVRAKDYATAAQRREDYTSTLYALSVDLASATSIDRALETVSWHVRRACQCKSIYLLPDNGELKVAFSSDGVILNDKEMTAANWTFKQGIPAGKETDTLASAALKYYPLRTPQGVVGVMGVQASKQEGLIKLEHERLITAFASQIAVSIERIQFWERLCKHESVPAEQSRPITP